MIPSSQNKNFTAADIERYHAGTLTAAERHALEKAALSDPFLADALEGYAFAPTPASDLDSLKQRLAERTAKKKSGTIIPMYRSWMSVAALFILLAGGIWLFITLNHKNTQLAEDITPTAQKSTLDSTSASVTATTPAELPKPADSNFAVPNTQAATTTDDAAAKTEKAKSQDEANDDKESKPASKDLEVTPANGLTRYNRYNNAYNQKMGPAPNYGNVTNSSIAMDSSALASKPFKAPSDFSKRADTISNVNVVLKPLNQPASEVVVLSKAPTKTESMLARARTQGVVIDSLEPAEGWIKFDDYVAANLQTPTDRKEKPERGEVQLAFDVNSEGAPVNITVVKSLCAQCDEEAVRLLREGPKWKKKKKAKGKVTIHF